MKTIYISGPIKKITDGNIDAFDKAETQLKLMPMAWVSAYTLPNSVREDLKPVVLELAMLLLTVFSCSETAFRPVRAMLKLMVFPR